jgi:hypothetical protein
MLISQRRYESRAPASVSESDSEQAGVTVCDYPRCQCCFMWCGGEKHPPCPITGRRHPEMLK